MSYTTIISVSELVNHVDDPNWVIVDCRFSLDNQNYGRQEYLSSHIPGAVYAHLNEDLSGHIISGKTGRHPLPQQETFIRTLSKLGIDAGVQVVTYDDKGGAMAAARLWWMLRWMGHDAVAVLNGGWQQWKNTGRRTANGMEAKKPRIFASRAKNKLLYNSADVLKILHDAHFRILDSRSADRYRGEHETIDPVAGHIPGALSAPFSHNLDSAGLFLPPKELNSRFRQFLGTRPAECAVFYCGSGVTAAHNLLALAHAGMGDGRLYAGSWSEWITHPDYPVER